MIQTELTRMFGLQHPIVLAPMGGVSGGRLAAAVSNAGGLGLVGGGYGDPESEGAKYQDAVRAGDYSEAVVWAGEAVDLILSVESAAALVTRISAEAEARLASAAGLVGGKARTTG